MKAWYMGRDYKEIEISRNPRGLWEIKVDGVAEFACKSEEEAVEVANEVLNAGLDTPGD